MSSPFDIMYEEHTRIPLGVSSALMVHLHRPTEAPELTEVVKTGQLKIQMIKESQGPEVAAQQLQEQAMVDPTVQQALDYEQAVAERDEYANQLTMMSQQMDATEQRAVMAEQTAAQIQQAQADTQMQAQQAQEQANAEAAGKQEAIQQAVMAKDENLQSQMAAANKREQLVAMADGLKEQLEQFKQTAAQNPVVEQQQMAMQQQAMAQQPDPNAPAEVQKEQQQAINSQQQAATQGQQAEQVTQQKMQEQQQQAAMQEQAMAEQQAAAQQQMQPPQPMPPQQAPPPGGMVAQSSLGSRKVNILQGAMLKAAGYSQKYSDNDLMKAWESTPANKKGDTPDQKTLMAYARKLNREGKIPDETMARAEKEGPYAAGDRLLEPFWSQSNSSRLSKRASKDCIGKPHVAAQEQTGGGDRIRTALRAIAKKKEKLGDTPIDEYLGKSKTAVSMGTAAAMTGGGALIGGGLGALKAQDELGSGGDTAKSALKGAGIGALTGAGAAGVLKGYRHLKGKGKPSRKELEGKIADLEEQIKRGRPVERVKRKLRELKDKAKRVSVRSPVYVKGAPEDASKAVKATADDTPIQGQYHKTFKPVEKTSALGMPKVAVSWKELGIAAGSTALGAGAGAGIGALENAKRDVDKVSDKELDAKYDAMAARVRMKQSPSYKNKVIAAKKLHEYELQRAGREHPTGNIARRATQGAMVGGVAGPSIRYIAKKLWKSAPKPKVD